jgi:hypothetical protein
VRGGVFLRSGSVIEGNIDASARCWVMMCYWMYAYKTDGMRCNETCNAKMGFSFVLFLAG